MKINSHNSSLWYIIGNKNKIFILLFSFRIFKQICLPIIDAIFYITFNSVTRFSDDDDDTPSYNFTYPSFLHASR